MIYPSSFLLFPTKLSRLLLPYHLISSISPPLAPPTRGGEFHSLLFRRSLPLVGRVREGALT